MTHSNIDLTSLELQRFAASRKMTALNYVRDLPGCGVVTARVVPHPSSLVLPVASTPVVMGVWQH